jgi:aspartyl-tRNA(Asn)/glutamyl-tRNA(Gln) amidotransferase subunit A
MASARQWEALAALEKRGAVSSTFSLPHAELAIPAYYVIAPAEASSNLARYDGVRFGHRCSDPASLEDLYSRSRAKASARGQAPHPDRHVRAVGGYYDAYYLRAQRVRRLIANDFSKRSGRST